ncbi:hypothetical protein SD81_040255 [Tolypothrix campylonemoides VB511288]|nr:hypothetical protein SD81_040255 [Tolypothrix campylonemoides VB511288]
MFTKEQLNLLIEIQQEDDWHPSYFFQLVKERNDHELTFLLFTYTFQQIKDLQLALDLLGNLPQIGE